MKVTRLVSKDTGIFFTEISYRQAFLASHVVCPTKPPVVLGLVVANDQPRHALST